MRSVFYIVAFLVAYGSFYPFNFDLNTFDQNRLAALFNFDISRTGLSDVVSNIVLFIPFGFLFRPSHAHLAKPNRFALFIFFGFIYAFVIQVLQLWMPERLPWGGDAVLNVIGFSIGYSLFSVTQLNQLNRLTNLTQAQQIAFALGAALILFKLSPFAPSLDFGNLKDNIKQVFLHPSLDLFWVYENTVTWLVGFFLIRQSQLFQLTTHRVVLLVVAVLSLKFFIVANTINLDRLAGGVLAMLLWLSFSRYFTAAVVTGLFVLAVFGNAFYPFELRETAVAFKWVPFTGSLSGNILLNILAVGKKLVFYASLVWLTFVLTKRLLLSTVSVAIALFCSEYAQRFFTNSVPESTDAFLVLFIGFIISRMLVGNSQVPIEATSNADLPVAQPSSQVLSTGGRTQHYIAGLDGLRAIAAMSVFVVHFQQFSGVGGSIWGIDFERWMINGNTGVGLFFALSGFLLAMPFWQGFSQGKMPNIKRYLLNRTTRIIPLYYACFFALLAVKGFSGPDANFNNILSHLLFLHNLKDHQVMSLNPPFWTLAVEVQFYLVLPLLFLLLTRLTSLAQSRLVVFVSILACVGLYQGVMFALSSNTDWPIRFPLIWPIGVELTSIKSGALKYSTLAHLPHFLLGVLAASIYLHSQWIKKAWIAELVFWLSAALLFVMLATELDEVFQHQYGRYNFPYVPVLLTLVVLTAPLSRYAKSVLEFKPLALIGVVSYGVYIFHYPIQKLVMRVLPLMQTDASTSPLLFAAIALVATLVAAFISYYYFEQPIIHYVKRRFGTAQYARANTAEVSVDTPVEAVSVTPQKSNPMQSKKMQRYGLITASVILLCAAASAGYYVFSQSTSRGFLVEQAPWSGKGNTLIFDHHAHTTYSDGSFTVGELVEEAHLKGCDAMTISDHTDKQRSFNDEKLSEIQGMREAYPGLLIVAALEVGIPSYDQREHVNVLTVPEFEKPFLSAIMGALGQIYGTEQAQDDTVVLNAMNALQLPTNSYFGVYNHPSRKDLSLEENAQDILNWNETFQLIHAFSGAPGHQNKSPIGSYATKFFTQDRWDPVVAEVGGVWDQQLAKGNKIWGAIASSDFHGPYMDYFPCEFSRIHVEVPSRDYQGLFEGLHAGTFWADHGKLLNDFEFSLALPNTADVANPGAMVTLSSDEVLLTINLEFARGEEYLNDYLRFDLISNCASESVLEQRYFLTPDESRKQFFLPLPINKKSCFVRSRMVRDTVEDDENLSAYSNPIMIEFH